MQHIIPDPDFEGFDGNFVDNSIWNAPPNQYKLSEVANYLRETKRTLKICLMKNWKILNLRTKCYNIHR